jgi:hypothetical protein
MRFLPVLLVAAAMAMPASLAAQKMTPGTWTGTISPPNGGSLEALFDVRVAGDTTKITIRADGRAVETTDIKVEKDRLLYTFAPGNSVIRCTLLLATDKSYSGDCVDDAGAKGVIVMRPPKQ